MPSRLADVDDLVHADLLGDAHRDQVARLLEPDAQRDRAQEIVAEVLRLASAAGPGPGRTSIGASRTLLAGVMPDSSARQVDERLEGGARLASAPGSRG